MNSMKALLTKQPLILLPGLPLILAAALCANPLTSLAGQPAPGGPVNFSFTSSSVPVYDLSGSYQFNHAVAVAGGAAVNLSLGCSLAQDATGRLRGSGATNIQVGSDLFPAQYSVNGKVTGGGGKTTRASLSVRWTVQDTAAGGKPSTISVQYNLEVNLGLLNGTARGRAKLPGLGNGTIQTAVTGVPLPAGVDGSWYVTMNLAPPGGSASVKLPNGRALQANPMVNYSARSGLERVKLSGTGTDRGTAITVNFLPTTGVLDSLSGKVLGQNVTLKNAGGRIVSQTVSPAAATSAYAGFQACLECHSPIQQTLAKTVHVQVGVECENCHGPAANHAANDYDPLTRPVVDYAGTLCGTCHSGPKHPIYEEWQSSEHSEVVTDLNPPDRISSCGRCHSGSVRVNLVEGTPLPVGNANQPLGCPTCHQPHQLTGISRQLRNPLFSTNDYSLSTTSVFTNNYDPSVNLCGQCHNDRGATWTDSSEPPHQSPQYNMLLGTVGELPSGLAPNDPASHALYITNQCVGCHMQTSPYQSASQPAVTGHSVAINSYEVCADCHASAVNASNLVVFVNGVFTNQITVVQGLLNQWATNDAPAILGTAEYGTRAWEYTTPGALSPGGPGPNAAQQALIPVNIQKARYNLYLVLYDGSLGVHNPLYSKSLLDTAESWVRQELSP
jgi:Cytochrome c554 and c-prime